MKSEKIRACLFLIFPSYNFGIQNRIKVHTRACVYLQGDSLRALDKKNLKKKLYFGNDSLNTLNFKS